MKLILLLVTSLILTGLTCSAQTYENQTLPAGITTYPGATLVLRNCLITGPITCNQAKSITVENCFLNLNGQNGLMIEGGCPVVYFGKCVVENARVVFQLNQVWNDPNVTVEWIQSASGESNNWNDQFSVYMSSGTPNRSIILRNLYVQVDPRSPHALLSGGIVAGDWESSYVTVADCLLVNCQPGLWYGNGCTSELLANYVSLSTTQQGSSGLAVRSGYAIGNVVDFSGPSDSAPYDFRGAGGLANNVTGSITNLYWQWLRELKAHDITLGFTN
jgi:hypothetical protein